jgi:hypothetical protein
LDPWDPHGVVRGSPATSLVDDRVQLVARATLAETVTAPLLAFRVFGEAMKLVMLGFGWDAAAEPARGTVRIATPRRAERMAGIR